jgi:hypothetical protein
MNNLWIVIISLVIFQMISVAMIRELKKDKKNLISNCKHFAEDSRHYYNKFQEERARQEFAKDDTLAKALYRTIIQRQKLQVHEIDASFSTMTSLSILQRMQIKNELLQLNWMEQGIVEKG